ncbi:MAG TPA: hypothetical protein VFA05_10580 [Gaiellaceae bacterium]|nr:hypothetical protein [Gaiellaceae bacterium]
MPRIHLSDPALVDQLLADLRREPDVVAERDEDGSVLVNIVASLNSDAMRVATVLRIRAWEEAQRAKGVDVRVTVE